MFFSLSTQHFFLTVAFPQRFWIKHNETVFCGGEGVHFHGHLQAHIRHMGDISLKKGVTVPACIAEKMRLKGGKTRGKRLNLDKSREGLCHAWFFIFVLLMFCLYTPIKFAHESLLVSAIVTHKLSFTFADSSTKFRMTVLGHDVLRKCVKEFMEGKM